MMVVNLRQEITVLELEILSALPFYATLRSLSRAKGILPPHLSKLIKRLEQKTSQTIIKRSVRGIVLTPVGTEMARKASAIVESISQLGAPSTAQNEITIGTSRFLAMVIAKNLESVRLGRHFRLLDLNPEEISEVALASVCDVVVLLNRPPRSSAWVSHRVGNLEWGLFANAKHPIKSRVFSQEVEKWPLVSPFYWTGRGLIKGEDHCPIRKRGVGDETSSLLSGVELVLQSETQLIFAPQLAVGSRLRRVDVEDWPKVQTPVFLAAQSDRVTMSFYRALSRNLKNALAAQADHLKKA